MNEQRAQAVKIRLPAIICSSLAVGACVSVAPASATAPQTKQVCNDEQRATALASISLPAPAPPCVQAAALAATQPQARLREDRKTKTDRPLIFVAGGHYVPFINRQKTFTGKPPTAKPVAVTSFWLDQWAVSNGDFRQFVLANRQWQRSHVASLLADKGYLSHWTSDEGATSREADSPVVNVSWHAANAFCRWQGKRLPTLDEWEYAHLAHASAEAAAAKAGAWFGSAAPQVLPPAHQAPRNALGVAGLDGPIWEWTLDYASQTIGANGSDQRFVCGDSADASDAKDFPGFMRYAMRASLKANFALKLLGFRCAKDHTL